MNKKIIKAFLLSLMICCGQFFVHSQNISNVIIRGKVFSDSDPGLISATICEIDATNRIVSSAITDINGNFSLKIKNSQNKLKFSYVGFNTHIEAIGSKVVFNVKLVETTQLKDVTIIGKKTTNTGTLDIPKREITTGLQQISAKEFEGLSVTSVDDALQGRIAGLDILNNSGDLGSGSSMRIRGITSINSSSEPLIVVNGVIFDTPNASNFDYSTANQEQFATLLSVNVDDIESITVLKDAASTAVWGSRGANGVISINTKKGLKGKTKVQYSYRFSGAVQPKGMTMLNGDDYTMLMKEAYFNPTQSDGASNIREFNYDQTYSEYQNYNNNTDWIKAVTQFGTTHDHYLQISGGGDRARFLISGGYYNQTGTIIKQQLDRFTNRVNLDYNISDRIKVSSEFSFTKTFNQENYGKLLSIAYKMMPNMSIYAQDANGNNTDRFFKMPVVASNTTDKLSDMRAMTNPVALANLAKQNVNSLRVLPTFRLQYDILDPNVQMLRFKSYVAFDVNNENKYYFFPKELTTSTWTNGSVNSAKTEDSRSLSISSDENLTWMPKFDSKDHSLMLYGSFQFGTSTSKYQTVSSYSAPNGILGSTSGGYITSFATSPGESRWMAFMGMAHYVFMDRYIADITVRRDGSTKFGDDQKWGTFPGISLGWNVADEPFMKKFSTWLSTLKLRPSWGMTGNQPKYEYLYYSLYDSYSSYLGTPTIRPSNIQLNNLKWEKVTSFNYGFDLGLMDDAFTLDFNYYFKHTADMLFQNLGIPSSSGYTVLTYQNAGTMDNRGWEVNLNANKLIKQGDFSVSFNLNLSNYVNTIIDLDESILKSYNSDYQDGLGSYLTRIQLNNSFGSIYGFRYKGVYQYNDYEPGREGISPYALDETGKLIRDANGDPLKMTFSYNSTTGTAKYTFKGGDAIYEDVNHDGTVNQYDIVYLGDSNPFFNGGFGIKINYKRLSANIFSNFRFGSKNVNMARMYAENMYNNYNQCASVNWRWRKDGDITDMPRALNSAGYNWLASDRYVEDGSFWRFKYVQINYGLDPKFTKMLHINQMSIYLTVNNLFTITKYSGVDPEVNYSLGSGGISIDNNQTPRSQSFTAGVTVIL